MKKKLQPIIVATQESITITGDIIEISEDGLTDTVIRKATAHEIDKYLQWALNYIIDSDDGVEATDEFQTELTHNERQRINIDWTSPK